LRNAIKFHNFSSLYTEKGNET